MHSFGNQSFLGGKLSNSNKWLFTVFLVFIAILVVILIAQPDVYGNKQQMILHPKTQINITGEGKMSFASDRPFKLTRVSDGKTVEGIPQTVLPPEWKSDTYFWTDELNSSGEWVLSPGDILQIVHARTMGDITVIVRDWLWESLLHAVVMAFTLLFLMLAWG